MDRRVQLLIARADTMPPISDASGRLDGHGIARTLAASRSATGFSSRQPRHQLRMASSNGVRGAFLPPGCGLRRVVHQADISLAACHRCQCPILRRYGGTSGRATPKRRFVRYLPVGYPAVNREPSLSRAAAFQHDHLRPRAVVRRSLRGPARSSSSTSVCCWASDSAPIDASRALDKRRAFAQLRASQDRVRCDLPMSERSGRRVDVAAYRRNQAASRQMMSRRVAQEPSRHGSPAPRVTPALG